MRNGDPMIAYSSHWSFRTYNPQQQTIWMTHSSVVWYSIECRNKTRLFWKVNRDTTGVVLLWVESWDIKQRLISASRTAHRPQLIMTLSHEPLVVGDINRALCATAVCCSFTGGSRWGAQVRLKASASAVSGARPCADRTPSWQQRLTQELVWREAFLQGLF